MEQLEIENRRTASLKPGWGGLCWRGLGRRPRGGTIGFGSWHLEESMVTES